MTVIGVSVGEFHLPGRQSEADRGRMKQPPAGSPDHVPAAPPLAAGKAVDTDEINRILIGLPTRRKADTD